MQSGPLYAAVAGSAVANCAVTRDNGVQQLNVRFADGNQFTARQDDRIEFTEQKAVFSQPLTRDPIELLKGAERAQFGASGCGIDWLRPDVQASPSPAGLSEQVFRGDVCNCQGRVCRDLQGNVRALQWRSAC